MKPEYPGFAPHSSRRSVLKGTVAGVTGLAAVAGVVGAGTFLAQRDQGGAAHAQNVGVAGAEPVQTILNVAITAEQLAVTFYTQALAHADRIGFGEAARLDIAAALVEEQIHEQFLAKQKAKALTSKFSFPFGRQTFERMDAFIKVQQQLETLFVAAYIASAREFAVLKRPDLVQIAMQIGTVEAEHRALGRAIGGLRPADNHAFSPALVKNVGDAAAILKKDGYLTPKPGNMFEFKPVSTTFDGLVARSEVEQTWS
ncbi:MAG: ferritin-like domain-containing protein [Chloroflexota bacterium]|nr:ferritin-like domain-containing protein [Chloroflexota bacterium]